MPPRKRKSDYSDRPARQVTLWLTARHAQALERTVERTGRSMTKELLLALESHCKNLRTWDMSDESIVRE